MKLLIPFIFFLTSSWGGATPSTVSPLISSTPSFLADDILVLAQIQELASAFDQKVFAAEHAQGSELEHLHLEIRELSEQLEQRHVEKDQIEARFRNRLRQIVFDDQAQAQILSQLSANATIDGPAIVLAKFALLRMWSEMRVEPWLGENLKLIKPFFASGLPRPGFHFPFDPMSDEAALNYKLAHDPLISVTQLKSRRRVSPAASDPVVRVSGMPGQNYDGTGFPAGSFAVTYDDGPSAAYSIPIMHAWKNSRMAMPTFFWLSLQLAQNPQAAEALAKSGAEIACHSHDHADLGNLINAQSYGGLNAINAGLFLHGGWPNQPFAQWKSGMLNFEIVGAADRVESFLRNQGQSAKVTKFRLPYGSGVGNGALYGMMRGRGLSHIRWNIDSLDWQDHNPQSILRRIQSQMNTQGRGIILLHDTHPQSHQTTLLLIPYFQSRPDLKVEALGRLL